MLGRDREGRRASEVSRNEKLGPLAPGQRRTVARKREAVLRLLRGFIPPEKLKHSEWRAQTAPRGRIPESAPGGQDEAQAQDPSKAGLATSCGKPRWSRSSATSRSPWASGKSPSEDKTRPGGRRGSCLGLNRSRSLGDPRREAKAMAHRAVLGIRLLLPFWRRHSSNPACSSLPR